MKRLRLPKLILDSYARLSMQQALKYKFLLWQRAGNAPSSSPLLLLISAAPAEIVFKGSQCPVTTSITTLHSLISLSQLIMRPSSSLSKPLLAVLPVSGAVHQSLTESVTALSIMSFQVPIRMLRFENSLNISMLVPYLASSSALQ